MSQPALTRVVQQLRLTVGAADGVSDAQLLERFLRQRDEVAFELLVRRHERLVLGVCRRVLRNVHDVDDAFQATFLLLVRKAGSIGKRSALAAWLHQVAFRVALRANDDSKRRTGRQTDIDPATLPSREPDPAAAQLRDLGPILDQELTRLPERYRAAVALCYLEGCTYEEAGQRLGCPRGTVSIWLTRARDLLRSRLARHGVVLSVGALFAVMSAQAQAAPVVATVQAALAWAAGQTSAALVSARAASLAQGVLKTMFLTKLKLASAVVLATVLATGSGWLALHAGADEGGTPPLQPPAVGVPPPAGDHLDLPAPPTWQEKRKIDGHSDTIMSVVFSPDAKQMATGGLDGLVKIWDVATGKELKRLNANPVGDPVHAVAFSPDGKRLAIAGGIRGQKGQVTLWETADPRPLFHFGNPTDVATSVAFSPDGNFLVLGSRDKKVSCFHFGPGGDRVPPWSATLPALWSTTLSDGVFSVAFSPDGSRVVAAGGAERVKEDNAPGEVQVFDARTGKTYYTQKDHGDRVTSVAFSPDGKLLASAGFDETVRVWDAATGKEVRRLEGHRQVVRAVAFSPDGKHLASAGFDGKVRVWDAATGKEVAVLTYDQAVTTVVFSPDGKWLVAASGGEILIYEAATGKAVGKPAAGVVGDRLDALLQDLLKRQRSDEQVIEALFLATLGRLPTDVEKKFCLDTVNKANNRGEAFRDVLFALTNTPEFRNHAAALAERARRPVK